MAFPWMFFDDGQSIISMAGSLRCVLDEIYKERGVDGLRKEIDRLEEITRLRVRLIQKHLMDDESGLTRLADISRSMNGRIKDARDALDLKVRSNGALAISHLGFVLGMLHAMSMTISLLPKEQKEETEGEVQT